MLLEESLVILEFLIPLVCEMLVSSSTKCIYYWTFFNVSFCCKQLLPKKNLMCYERLRALLMTWLWSKNSKLAHQKCGVRRKDTISVLLKILKVFYCVFRLWVNSFQIYLCIRTNVGFKFVIVYWWRPLFEASHKQQWSKAVNEPFCKLFTEYWYCLPLGWWMWQIYG